MKKIYEVLFLEEARKFLVGVDNQTRLNVIYDIEKAERMRQQYLKHKK
ncbi:MAG: hypothetical protein ACKVQV_01295 [Bacteroidia bacterium]